MDRRGFFGLVLGGLCAGLATENSRHRLRVIYNGPYQPIASYRDRVYYNGAKVSQGLVTKDVVWVSIDGAAPRQFRWDVPR